MEQQQKQRRRDLDLEAKDAATSAMIIEVEEEDGVGGGTNNNDGGDASTAGRGGLPARERDGEEALQAWTDTVVGPLLPALEGLANLLTCWIDDDDGDGGMDVDSATAAMDHSDSDDDNDDDDDDPVRREMKWGHLGRRLVELLIALGRYRQTMLGPTPHEGGAGDGGVGPLVQDINETIGKACACITNSILDNALARSEYRPTWDHVWRCLALWEEGPADPSDANAGANGGPERPHGLVRAERLLPPRLCGAGRPGTDHGRPSGSQLGHTGNASSSTRSRATKNYQKMYRCFSLYGIDYAVHDRIETPMDWTTRSTKVGIGQDGTIRSTKVGRGHTPIDRADGEGSNKLADHCTEQAGTPSIQRRLPSEVSNRSTIAHHL
jgi:hypothetical protein